MKKFTDYTRSEKEAIIRRGGDDKKHLNEALGKWLDTLEFTKDQLNIINSTNPYVELFGLCDTKEDVIEIINEINELEEE